jgi:hypothetical protein
MAKYLKQQPDKATLEVLADFICGDDEKFPIYRSSSYLTRFFQNINIDKIHDGSTRKWWVLETLENLSLEEVERVILRLVDIREYKGDQEFWRKAVDAMRGILLMEDFEIEFNGKEPVLINHELTSTFLDDTSKSEETENKKTGTFDMSEEWYERWWAKYLIFPIVVLVIAGIMLWKLGIS